MRNLISLFGGVLMCLCGLLLLGCRKRVVSYEPYGVIEPSEFLVERYLVHPQFILTRYGEGSGGGKLVLLCTHPLRWITPWRDSVGFRRLAARYGDGGFKLYHIDGHDVSFAEPLEIRFEVLEGVKGTDTVWKSMADSVMLEFYSFIPMLQKLRSATPPLIQYPESAQTAVCLAEVKKGDLKLVDGSRPIAFQPIPPYRFAREFRVSVRAGEERWQVLNSDKRGGD